MIDVYITCIHIAWKLWHTLILKFFVYFVFRRTRRDRLYWVTWRRNGMKRLCHGRKRCMQRSRLKIRASGLRVEIQSQRVEIPLRLCLVMSNSRNHRKIEWEIDLVVIFRFCRFQFKQCDELKILQETICVWDVKLKQVGMLDYNSVCPPLTCGPRLNNSMHVIIHGIDPNWTWCVALFYGWVQTRNAKYWNCLWSIQIIKLLTSPAHGHPGDGEPYWHVIPPVFCEQ